MDKRQMLDDQMLDNVSGGALDVRVSKSEQYGICTSTVTGETYYFDKANKTDVYRIVASSGTETAKLAELAKYWVTP